MSFLAAIMAAVALAGCTTFAERTKTAQTEIEKSFVKLGYSPSRKDTIEYTSTPRTMRGQTWMERQVRFLDHCDRDGTGLTKFFRKEAGFKFDHDIVIGESESDLQKIRWYEFKIDSLYTVYRVEFVREAAAAGTRHSTPLDIEQHSTEPQVIPTTKPPRTPRSP